MIREMPEAEMARFLEQIWDKTLPQQPTMEAWDREAITHLLWLADEVRELADAYASGDMEATAHELTDVDYIVHALYLMLGLPRHALFKAVHAANLVKLAPDGSGPCEVRDGRPAKCEHYTAPDIAHALTQNR